MSNSKIIIESGAEPDFYLSITELTHSSNVSPEFLEELISLGIIDPVGPAMQFDSKALQRTRKAFRLHHDLEVNLAGVAVILDLLEQLDALYHEQKVWRKPTE